MNRIATFAALLLAGQAWAAEPKAPAAAEPRDAMFRALDEEVGRAKTLSMEGLDKPYWVAAYGQESELFEVAASFGALVTRDGGRNSTLDTQVRVGSMDLDNTNFIEDYWGGGYRRGRGVPAEQDYDALRRALWLQFDDRYKKAAETIAKKRAFLKTNAVKDRPADFTPAKVETLVLPRQELALDRDRWTALVKKASAVFLGSPAAHACRVTLRGSLSHQYFVSSEGARHRFPEPILVLNITAVTQAADGMELSSSWTRWGREEKDLPDEKELLQAAMGVARHLEQLAKSPMPTEDYAGPVLFTGRAAGIFYLATVGEPLSRPRDELGAARQGRLVDRVGKHVASKLVSVKDDPTQTHFRGQPLMGHFPIDDDSVKPQPLSLVEDGVLKTYFMSRVPTKRLKETNGHSRNGEGAPGNLFVETKSPQPVDALTRRLLELAKEEDYDYALVVEDFDVAAGMRWGRMNEVVLPAPSVVWKVWADGRREPARGYTFKPMSFRVLKDVVGLGDDPTVANVDLRNQRTSAIAPSTLIRMAELQKTNADFEKPPATPRPAVARAAGRK